MAATYNRVVISGSLAGGEIWSVNPGFVGPAGTGGSVGSFEDLQAWAQDIAALNGGTVLPDSLLGLISSSCVITRIRTEALTAAGELLQAAETTPGNTAKGTGNVTKPFQTSVVASLQSGRPGRSYAGRIYWPALGLAIFGDTGRISPNLCQGYANDTAAWLDDVATAAPVGAALVPAVVSHKLALQTPITQVRVGDVPDTQRRRRDGLLEQYAVAPL